MKDGHESSLLRGGSVFSPLESGWASDCLANRIEQKQHWASFWVLALPIWQLPLPASKILSPHAVRKIEQPPGGSHIKRNWGPQPSTHPSPAPACQSRRCITLAVGPAAPFQPVCLTSTGTGMGQSTPEQIADSWVNAWLHWGSLSGNNKYH